MDKREIIQEILDLFIKVLGGLVIIKMSSKVSLDELNKLLLRLEELMKEEFLNDKSKKISNKEILKSIDKISKKLEEEFPHFGEEIEKVFKEALEELVKELVKIK